MTAEQGKAIRLARVGMGARAKEIADIAGITAWRFGKIERGEGPAPLEPELWAIKQALKTFETLAKRKATAKHRIQRSTKG